MCTYTTSPSPARPRPMARSTCIQLQLCLMLPVPPLPPFPPVITQFYIYVFTIGAKKIDAKIKKTANIEKAVTFFLEEIEQKFKQI
jgi:hypothetical protein